MKRYLLLVLLLLATAHGGATDWSDEVLGKTLHWKAEQAELRDIDGVSKYDYGIGGINIPGGDIAAVFFTDRVEFDFLHHNTQLQSVTVEGDMGIIEGGEINSATKEYHLLVLPLRVNQTSIADLLGDHLDFLENMTGTKSLDYSKDTGTIRYEGEFNGTHTVIMEWDTMTGILTRKTVTSMDGHSLVVEQGEGKGFGLQSLAPFPLVVSILALVVFRRARES